MTPRGLRFTIATALLFTALPAHADEKQMCVDAHAQSQRLRRAGKLLDARQTLLSCIRPDCPSAVAQDCTTWLGEVNAEMPSVVLAARDEHGQDVAVRVVVDGVVVAQKLDGRPIEMDPGEHSIRYEQNDGRFVETHVIVSAAEKFRSLRVDFPEGGTPPTARVTSPRVAPGVPVAPRVTPTRSKIPVSGIIVGSVGVVALGVFAGLGADGVSRESHLSGTCSPRCSPSDVSSVESEYHAADISLGVGVLALGAATWLTLSHVFSKDPPTAASLRFELVPVMGGAAGRLGRAF